MPSDSSLYLDGKSRGRDKQMIDGTGARDVSIRNESKLARADNLK